MKKEMDPSLKNRNALLRKCLELGMSTSSIHELVHPMHDKTDEEKEQMAAELLAQLEAQNPSSPKEDTTEPPVTAEQPPRTANTTNAEEVTTNAEEVPDQTETTPQAADEPRPGEGIHFRYPIPT